MLDNLKIRKKIIGIGLFGLMIQAQAEVLIILPDSGPMARASSNIKSGIDIAYKASNAQIPLKFVKVEQLSINQLLKNNINKNTQLIIGPLARSDVESLIKSNPKVPVLALNEVTLQHPKTWQFSLAKSDDAAALVEQINRDKTQHLYIMREEGSEKESMSFVNELFKSFNGQVSIVDQLPKLKSKDGVLLLGKMDWIKALKNKPHKRLYVQAMTVNETKTIPMGTKFCDVPMLFNEKLNIHKANISDAEYAFQRLNAFGQDAWKIAEQMLKVSNPENISIDGMTGHLSVKKNRIERRPACFEKTWFRLKQI
jgi:uncharacterized protein